jgi:LacI family transcriptional regulator
MRGAEAELRDRGYYLILSTVSIDPPPRSHEFALVREGRVDGLILAGPVMPARFVLGLQAMGCKVVLVDNRLEHTSVDCVVIDDRMGGYAATSHLIEHGYRRIAHIGGPSAWPSSEARFRGYREAMLAQDLEPMAIRQAETTLRTGYQAMEKILDRGGVRAVFAANDAMAMGGIKSAREHGLAVPEDVAFVGFDDVEFATHCSPSLTTLHVPKRQVGMLAARRLLELVNGKDLVAAVTTSVSTELVVRHSCGCVP